MNNFLKLTVIITLLVFCLLRQPTKLKTVKKAKQDIIHIKGRDSYEPYLGIKYVWGGNSKRGTDCSGLINMIYHEKYHKNIPRTAQQISYIGVKINIDSLKEGDLLFFGRNKYKITHVAMYIKDRHIIQSVSKGSQIDSIGSHIWQLYWNSRFQFAKRILD